MNQKAVCILLLALIMVGCATMSKTGESKETNLQKIEKMVGGKVLLYGGTSYYPFDSEYKRIRLLIEKKDHFKGNYEIRFVDVKVNKMSRIEAIVLVENDYSAMQSNTIKRADPDRFPVKLTEHGAAHSPIGNEGAGGGGLGELWCKTECQLSCWWRIGDAPGDWAARQMCNNICYYYECEEGRKLLEEELLR